MRESVMDERREETEALIRAMRKAGRHFVNPANWDQNARLLAAPDYLNAD
ncbi:MAG: nitrate transporter, partial [Nitrospira sp.]|nr:nitrate transporter [Nitrospira sp.]